MPVSGSDPEGRPRPSLPPLLVAGLVLWGTAALVWPRLAEADAAFMGALAVGAIGCAAILAVACALIRKVPTLALVVLGICAGCALSAVHGLALGASMSGVDGEREWACILAEDAKEGAFGWSARAVVEDRAGASLRARVQLPDDGGLWLQGDRLVVSADIRAPSAASRSYYWDGALAGSIDARAGKRLPGAAPLLGLRERAIDLLETYGGADAALPLALVCGYRPPIEASGLYDRFKAVGLAHLVAVSGAHLSIVTMFVAAGLRLLRLGRRATAVVTALFLLGYVCFTGMPVSALRAALMAATGLLGLVVNRRQSTLAALGLCLVLFVGADPSCAVSASFALSAGSTLGIALFAGPFSDVIGQPGSRLRVLVGDPVGLTAASAVATQPYASALFSQLPLLSPAANVVGVPLFTVGCVAGFASVLGACLAPGAAPWLVNVAVAACTPLSWAVSVLGSLPGTCLPIDASPALAVALSVSVCGALWLWWPRSFHVPLAGLAVAVAVLLAAPGIVAARGADELVMLDVGQGDAFLLRSQGRALLVDTGNEEALLREACAREGIRTLDAVVITHHDDDHCGSLESLGDVALLGGALVPQDTLSCPCAGCIAMLSRMEAQRYPQGVAGLALGDEVRCGRFTLRVLWPRRFTDEGGNADSLILLCAYDGNGDGAPEWTVLFTGDAEAVELAAVAPDLPEGGVDVLKVGHHGSRAALDEVAAAALSPSVALIGVGERNRYGHPSAEALSLLEAVGCRVFRSDEAGDVRVAFSMDKLTVATQRGEGDFESGTMGP